MKGKIKKLLLSYIFDGLVLIALGVAMLVWPEESLKTLCIIVGSLFILVGFVKIVGFIVNKSGERTAGELFVGILQFAFGAALVIKSGFFIDVFQVITGVILIYGAILMFIHAFKLRVYKGVMFALSLIFASITAVLAVIIIINPSQVASFMTQLHGISLVIEGVAMLMVLHRINPVRQARKAEKLAIRRTEEKAERKAEEDAAKPEPEEK